MMNGKWKIFFFWKLFSFSGASLRNAVHQSLDFSHGGESGKFDPVAPSIPKIVGN